MIPSHAHIIWLGPRLNLLAYFAVRSARDRGHFDTVTLHYDDSALCDDPLVRDLTARPGIEVSEIDLDALADADAEHTDALAPAVWDRLRALNQRMAKPVWRADLFRLALVWIQGGVYLDADLVVLRDFAPLLGEPGFAGLERISYPIGVRRSWNPLRWAHALALDGLRAAITRIAASPPEVFARVEGLYHLSTNNAVFGAPPRHPMLRRLLETATAQSDKEAHTHGRVGVALFQEVMEDHSWADFALHEPTAFYPFPPEVCITYFHDDPEARLGDVPHPEAYTAHLYENMMRKRLGVPLNADFLRRKRSRTLYTRMVEPYLDDFFAVQKS